MELLQLSELSRIEPRPGIYKMYDRGALLYVGKSKQLRHRVRQYFGGSHHAPKIRHMVARIDAVGIEYTPSHLEAMLAEEREIKRLQPPYNRILKREVRAVRFVPDRRAPLLYRLAPGGFDPVQKESFLTGILFVSSPSLSLRRPPRLSSPAPPAYGGGGGADRGAACGGGLRRSFPTKRRFPPFSMRSERSRRNPSRHCTSSGPRRWR